MRHPLARVPYRLRAAVRRAHHPAFFFVNIGANDGVTNDPIHPFLCAYGWRGIAVEPLEPVYVKLVRNYARFPGVTCERAAIAAQPRPLWVVPPAPGWDRPWTRQVGSLDPPFLRKTIVGVREHNLDGPVPEGLEASIVRVEVPCLTFDELMAKHRAARVDFINIDAEGLDHEIAASIDLDRWRPAIVALETAGLDEGQRTALDERFATHGYVLLGPIDVFSTAWVARRLRAGRVVELLDRLRAGLENALGR